MRAIRVTDCEGDCDDLANKCGSESGISTSYLVLSVYKCQVIAFGIDPFVKFESISSIERNGSKVNPFSLFSSNRVTGCSVN